MCPVTTRPHWDFWLCSKALPLSGQSPYLPRPWVPLLLAEDAGQQKTGTEPGLHSDGLFLAVSLASYPLHSPHRLPRLRSWVQIPPLGQVTSCL